MKRFLLGLALAVMLAGLFSVSSFACDNGCTPGYWKQSQHYDSWKNYAPDDKVCDMFDCPDGLMLKNGTLVSSLTLIDALNLGGGGLNALLRHAVASVLNVQLWPCDDMGPDGTIATVSAVLGGSPSAIEFLKDQLEDENEDYCPLN